MKFQPDERSELNCRWTHFILFLFARNIYHINRYIFLCFFFKTILCSFFQKLHWSKFCYARNENSTRQDFKEVSTSRYEPQHEISNNVAF